MTKKLKARKNAMNILKNILSIIGIFCIQWVSAQADIEAVTVETYYIADANDATDTDGGTLEEGTVTYRIFLDLAPGVKLISLFGNTNHTFNISSTDIIWNNEDRGKTFGFEIDNMRLDENTVALDSWLSFGLSSDLHFGLPKGLDPDSSIVGGMYNDGGSESITGGLLINQDALAGMPITTKDGLVEMIDTIIPNIVVAGDHPQEVFDDATVDSSYVSNNVTLLYTEGIQGLDSDNRVLVGQITTKGELSFELNVEIINANGDLVKYVANDEILIDNEVASPYLTFPPECGCVDPDFLEYDPTAACDDGSCLTLVVIGCSDPLACNYDPLVNLNVPELCCILPDNCEGLDPELICENLDVLNTDDLQTLLIYPNPFQDEITIALSPSEKSGILKVYDSFGQIVHSATLLPGASPVYLGQLRRGIYFVRIETSENVYERTLIKQ